MISASSPRPSDRHVSAAGLASLLGAWAQGGPAYLTLAEAMRHAVLDGALPPGTRLPSERELARALSVSRTTTAAAYQRLRDLDVLRTRRGSGSVTTLPGRARTADNSLMPTGTDGTGEAVDLSVAALPAPQQMRAATHQALEMLPAYLTGSGYDVLGLRDLRAALAQRYTDRGTPTSLDEIMITSGAQQAINLVLATTLGHGDRVVVEHPTYPHAIGAIRSTGARAVPVPVGPSGLDLDLLESTVRQTSPRLIHLTPDHHNPTGTSLDDDGRRRVRELAARHRTLVVADETLTDLTLDGPRPASFAGPATRAGVVTIGSASKSFWGGLRIGWVRAPRETIARLAAQRPRYDLGTSVLDQLITRELIAVETEILTLRRETLRTQRDALLTAVTRHLPWSVPTPAGGLSAWADLGAPVSSALTVLALRHGARIVPGPAFGLDGSFENRLRLTFAPPVEVIERGIAALAAAWSGLRLDAQPGQQTPDLHQRTVV